ncbi:hypothetical protein EJ04DRAFT_583258, partial [Polyplosphaeria fusca]
KVKIFQIHCALPTTPVLHFLQLRRCIPTFSQPRCLAANMQREQSQEDAQQSSTTAPPNMAGQETTAPTPQSKKSSRNTKGFNMAEQETTTPPLPIAPTPQSKKSSRNTKGFNMAEQETTTPPLPIAPTPQSKGSRAIKSSTSKTKPRPPIPLGSYWDVQTLKSKSNIKEMTKFLLDQDVDPDSFKGLTAAGLAQMIGKIQTANKKKKLDAEAARGIAPDEHRTEGVEDTTMLDVDDNDSTDSSADDNENEHENEPPTSLTLLLKFAKHTAETDLLNSNTSKNKNKNPGPFTLPPLTFAESALHRTSPYTPHPLTLLLTPGSSLTPALPITAHLLFHSLVRHQRKAARLRLAGVSDFAWKKRMSGATREWGKLVTIVGRMVPAGKGKKGGGKEGKAGTREDGTKEVRRRRGVAGGLLVGVFGERVGWRGDKEDSE